MRTIQINLYKYEELSETAKAKAREWWRDGDTFDANYEPAETAAAALGVTLALARDSKGSVTGPDIRWSGFYCQGDGASFVGSYTFDAKATQAIRDEFPTDKTLHSIADTLAEIQVRYMQTLTAQIEQRGRYVHAQTMALADVSPSTVTEDDEELLLASMRRFANWIWLDLRDSYEGEREDEAVADNIIANEYEFTADGTRSNG